MAERPGRCRLYNEAIPLPDASVDYVFTDPPFDSNLFYADK
jgi:16S rRNA G966 N2-methylase RsmD